MEGLSQHQFGVSERGWGSMCVGVSPARQLSLSVWREAASRCLTTTGLFVTGWGTISFQGGFQLL